MPRRTSERRFSTTYVGVDNRSGVDRRADIRRKERDQRWGNERRAYVWEKERGDWIIFQYDV